MMTPAFNSNDDRLTAYALGELEGDLRADFESELAGSAALQEELAELQSLAGMLRSELADEVKPTLTPEQHQGLLTRAAEATPYPVLPAYAPRPARYQSWAIAIPGIALGMTVAVGIAAYSYQRPATESLESALAANHLAPIKVMHSDRYSELSIVELSANDPRHNLDDLVEFKPKPDGRTLYATGSQAKAEKPLSASLGTQLLVEDEKSGVRWSDESRLKERLPQLLAKQRFYYVPAEGLGRVDQNGNGLFETQDAYYREHAPTQPLSETYEAPPENVFLTPSQQPLSTFSIDVDSASYSNVRRFLTQGQRPPADAVRVEEMVNYFTYNYPQPKEGEPFSVTADAAPCPWQPKNYLARIGLQARTIDKAKRPPTNLVFLLDVSGSMQAANKLPLVKQAMTMLCEELNERDRIAIVTYAGDAGVKLASTPGSNQTQIMQSIEALQAGGSTNGAAGINLAYEEALRHFNGEGENRVILCTDGDFNVGISSDDQLVELIQQQAKTKVFLSIFGFGMGNLKDAKLEKLADKGNGNYGYIDDLKEARRVFNEELVGTLYTVAKDVKIQVEFNPLTVGAYRLIGYENRALAAKDFNDDTKDAGEIGAGHTVTALYEIAPKGQWAVTQEVDPLKYGTNTKEAAPVETAPKKNLSPESADDLFTVKLRYKQPTADVSVKTIDYVVDDIAGKKIVPSPDLVWAASVASFGMQLRHSQFKGNWTLSDVYEAAQGAKGADTNGRRREFLDLVQAAKRLAPETKQ